MLPTGMDWIKTLDPLKQVVKQEEIDIALQKLMLLRALGPKAITGDIANLMNQVINASGGNVRRTIVHTFPLLVDKLLEFVDHWAVKVNSVISSSPIKEDNQPKANSSAGSFQIVQSEWQNYDDVERERMIPILQTELKSLREMYQERVDEINAFEYRMAELQEQAKKEALLLQQRLAAVQEEYDTFKHSTQQQHQLQSQQQENLESLSATDASSGLSTEESAELIELRDSCQQFQQDIQGLHAEIKHLLKEKDLLIQSATQLEEELHGTIMAKEKLTQQVADYRRQVEQIPQLETMLTMTNQQKIQAEAHYKKAETALKNQEKIVETLAKNLQKKEKEYQRLVQQLDTTQQQLRQTEDSLNALSNEKIAMETSLQSLHRTVEELQECKDILSKSQDELQRKVFALETDLVKSRVDNQNLQDDILSATNEKDILLMALETSQMKLREKIEELEAIEAQKRTQPTSSAAIHHIQQGIVGGVGNIVDYFEHRASSVSPVPGGAESVYNSASNANNNNAAAGKPAFPLLKRLSTGISSLAQGPTGPQQSAPLSHSSGGDYEDSNEGSKSHALAASIRSRYSSSSASGGSNNNSNSYPLHPSTSFEASEMDFEDDPTSYAPVPSTRDVDSDDET